MGELGADRKWNRDRYNYGSGAKLCIIVGLLLVLFAIVAATPAAAHSVLLEARPAPNATLAEAPREIRLIFNERMEKELYTIDVFDERGERVNVPDASMSEDQHEIYAALPPLPEGLYTVSYHIISADGHPLSESYVMTIGKPSGRTAAPELGHKHLETVYGFRMLHYLFFLLLIGWVGWRYWLPLETEEAARRYRLWLRNLTFLNAMFLIETIALETIDDIGQMSWANVASLWFHTSVGWMWIAAMALALMAYFVVGRRRSVDALWLVAAIVTQTLSGHPLAAVPVWTAAVPDAIHLAAAGVWTGGLGILLVFTKRVPDAARAFLPRFSRAATYSIIALAVTGTLTTLVYVPRLSDLLYTWWGRFLLLKLLLVAGVVYVGSRLRGKMRAEERSVAAEGNGDNGNGGNVSNSGSVGTGGNAISVGSGGKGEGDSGNRGIGGNAINAINSGNAISASNRPAMLQPLNRWLQLDFALMVAIVAIVGIFTYLSPAPANTPLAWKIDSAGTSSTLSITPNAPGALNQFALYVTQPVGGVPVKQAQLRIVSEDRPDVAPIEVALQLTESAPGKSLAPGHRMEAFTAEGRYLPFPGKWRLELAIRDANDDERVWTHKIRLFATDR